MHCKILLNKTLYCQGHSQPKCDGGASQFSSTVYLTKANLYTIRQYCLVPTLTVYECTEIVIASILFIIMDINSLTYVSVCKCNYHSK